jgi:hypothetical protein
VRQLQRVASPSTNKLVLWAISASYHFRITFHFSFTVFSCFPFMLDSGCELPRLIHIRNVIVLKALSRLDVLPLAAGVSAAAVGAALTPIIAPPALGMLGFSAAGPVASK